ncbi:MAG: DUF3703 domain-containing protein [Acidimicrobiales bacterium]|nr:DUF3703 domain-containing protein [Acidimicrobiales bacterium]
MNRSMPAGVQAIFDAELAAAQAAWDNDAAWAALERAHILSQPWAGPHVRCHLKMLVLACRTRDIREVAGQLFRSVLAGPGSMTGRIPLGNTGRARVSAFKPMPIPVDLAAVLDADEIDRRG